MIKTKSKPLNDYLRIAWRIALFGAAMALSHACWVSFDCNTRIWYAHDHGREYTNAQCMEARKAEGKPRPFIEINSD